MLHHGLIWYLYTDILLWCTDMIYWFDIYWYADILIYSVYWYIVLTQCIQYADILMYWYTGTHSTTGACTVYGIRYTGIRYTVHVLYQHLHAVSRWFGSLCHQFETTVWTLMTTFPCVQVDEDNRRFSLPTLFETICITVSGTCGKVCLRNLITQEFIV